MPACMINLLGWMYGLMDIAYHFTISPWILKWRQLKSPQKPGINTDDTVIPAISRLFIHTYIHTYIHACIHTCIHTYIHACIHTCIHAYTHTYIHIHPSIHPSIHTYIHTYIQTHIIGYMCVWLPGLHKLCFHLLYWCFLKWWYPQTAPRWTIVVEKPMVVGYHHFTKPPICT